MAVQQADAVPGTIHLVDIEGVFAAKHARGRAKEDIVLVPAPSEHPDDPLNWSPNRKRTAIASICM